MNNTRQILNIAEIRKGVEKLFEGITNVVEKSKFSSEEKLKIEVLAVLESFFRQQDIDFSNLIDYEVSKIGALKINGRIDALYGSVIVEFKKYNLLSTEKGLQESIKQVNEKYLEKIPEIVRKEFAGIIFDGKQIVFITYDPVTYNWSSDCRKFTVYALYDWLLLLSGLFKKTISYTALRDDFSIETILARDFIATFYQALDNNLTSNDRVKMLFNEWDRTFKYIYGGVLDEGKLVSDFQEIASKILKTEKNLRVDMFLFVIYTYYAFIIKLIASEIACISLKLPFDSPSKYLLKRTNLKQNLRLIEDGRFFREMLGIDNYIEGGFFSWYLDCWNEDIENNVRRVLSKINEYNPRTLTDHRQNSTDILRNLYQDIIPKRIRHDLGEFYTPQWLAQLTVEESGYIGDSKHKVLDPGCGSGTFIVEFINKIKNGAGKNYNKSELLKVIINNVIGFDVNPVAVLTARTNYLLAISDLLDIEKKLLITLPIYLADSILTPTTEGHSELKKDIYNISTVEGIFKIPKNLVDNGKLSIVFQIVEECIDTEYPSNDFIKLLDKAVIIDKDDREAVLEFYKCVLDLHRRNKNKIWTKIIQNSFAPLLYSQFDFVIGNPPWIKWEFLSEEYKKKLSVLYLNIYKLYSYKGMKAGMGFAHDDISIVFTYVCMDKYLKNGGILSFILKQTLYKGIAGKEFRKFAIEKENSRIPVKVLKVHDLVKLKPFKSTGAETSVAIIERGKETSYPVPYILWDVQKGSRVDETMSLSDVKKATTVVHLDASPDLDIGDVTDVWVLANNGEKLTKKIQSPNFYDVRHGVVNDLNSVFFIKILSEIDGNVLVENVQIGKKKVRNVKMRIEKGLIYPIVKPRHIKKWIINGYYYIIIPHKKHGTNNESELRVNFPKTYGYLFSFKDDLLKRASRWFKGGDKPFYSLFGIGEYTFKPFKVVWSSIGYLPSFAVASKADDKYLGNKKEIIPDNTISYISFDAEDEAYYVCGILNSESVLKLFSRRSTKSKWGISVSMVKNLPIPEFNPMDKMHKTLVALSKKAHFLTKKSKDVGEVESQINMLVETILNKN